MNLQIHSTEIHHNQCTIEGPFFMQLTALQYIKGVLVPSAKTEGLLDPSVAGI